jgi:hypothetical protein
MVDPNTAEEQFLIGLTELTRRTGVRIGACGCCGGPSLDRLTPAQLDERGGYASTQQAWEMVQWISPADEHDWEHYAKDIVK